MTIRLGAKKSAFQDAPKKEMPAPTKTPSSSSYYKKKDDTPPQAWENVFAIVKELHEREVSHSSRKGAPWEEVVALAEQRHRMNENQVEECLNYLFDKSLAYEQILGRIIPLTETNPP